MFVKFLSSKGYPDYKHKNYGDCILIDNGSELVIYDCGSEAHAREAIKYMNEHAHLKNKKANLVLSHNDADHFNGIPYLIEQGRLYAVYTILSLKYKKYILSILNDDRRTEDSITRALKEIYNNIASLSGKVRLRDIYEYSQISRGVQIAGPDIRYSLEAIAQNIDSRGNGSLDRETIVNAISTQLSVQLDTGDYLLLTGDCNFKAIESKIKDYKVIQLPHHGKIDQATEIFSCKNNDTRYIISDNTGNSNGGSKDLIDKERKMQPQLRHKIYNTKNGEVKIDKNTIHFYKEN